MFQIFDIEKETKNNTNFRKVIDTKGNQQLVLMSLKPLEDISMEMHTDIDQFIKIEQGSGKVIVDGKEYDFSDGFGFIIPSGCCHKIINTSETDYVKLYSIYSPPEHSPDRLDIEKPKDIKSFKIIYNN